MRLISITCCCLLFFSSSEGQSDSLYQSLIAKASLLHLQRNYADAIDLYEKVFQIRLPDALAAYKAAGVYALDSNANKAVHYLRYSLTSGWTEADWLSFDPYFDYLRNAHPDRWKAIEEQAFASELLYEKTLQLPGLRKEINLMTLNDQKLRYQYAQANTEDTRQHISGQITQSDLRNMDRAKEIIMRYGWPKVSQIGKDGQNNLWLIIQHADHDVLFQKAALLAMEKLIGTSELSMENYAFLYDRVQCNLNYRQLYGTQVTWTSGGEASAFRPIAKEGTVDERRKEIGLQPLHLYSLTYGFVYDAITVEEAKQRDSIYHADVQCLIDSAKFYYTTKEFNKTYDLYNKASTFLGGMSNADNYEAAVIFSRIASEDNDRKYRSIALDFLQLQFLRGELTRAELNDQPAFGILHSERRWVDLYRRLKG